jgi:hypothetical protein
LARYAHLLDGFTCLTNAGTTNSTSGRSAQAVRYAKFGLPNRYVPDAIARCRHRDRCAESCPGSTTPHVTTHLSSRRQSSKPLRNIYLFKAHFKKNQDHLCHEPRLRTSKNAISTSCCISPWINCEDPTNPTRSM